MAVNEAEPVSPVPDTPIDNVPSPIVGNVTHVGDPVPPDAKYWPTVPAAENNVVPDAD